MVQGCWGKEDQHYVWLVVWKNSSSARDAGVGDLVSFLIFIFPVTALHNMENREVEVRELKEYNLLEKVWKSFLSPPDATWLLWFRKDGSKLFPANEHWAIAELKESQTALRKMWLFNKQEHFMVISVFTNTRMGQMSAPWELFSFPNRNFL